MANRPSVDSGAAGLCPVDVLWDERFREYDFGEGHPFSERSRGLAVELLAEGGFFDGDRNRRIPTVPEAPRAELGLFHEEAYLDRVVRASGAARPVLLDAGDTPAFPGCFPASARIVGGTAEAVARVAAEGGRHLLQPAGGLHHARPGAASGFCIFNDLAVALHRLLRRGAVRRVAYVDLDAHHGDGVMYGFYDDGRVLDVDFHQDGRTLFPGTGAVEETGRGDGAGLKANLPLPPGSGDAEFIEVFDAVVPSLIEEFRPELILVQHGLDGHLGDPLAALRYTPVAYAHAMRELHRLAHRVAAGRLVVTGGGGYRPEHVSRGLARAAWLLTGGPGPAAAERLPETWRARWRSELGPEPPLDWSAPAAPSSDPSARRTCRAIVEQLSRELGRRLPVPGGAPLS